MIRVSSKGTSTSSRAGCRSMTPYVIARRDLERGSVDDAIAHLHMAVGDELPRLRPRGGQAQSMDHVVEARLHQLYKRRTGRLGVIHSSLEDASKLTLAHAVKETRLLLFLKLEQIFGAAATEVPTVLAWWIRPPGQRALPRRRLGTFQSKLGAEPSRDPLRRAAPAHGLLRLLDSTLNRPCLTGAGHHLGVACHCIEHAMQVCCRALDLLVLILSRS